jgi:WS/DGAT/MGAT family acyltransferase
MTAHTGQRSRYDRLTGADYANLLAERPSAPFHVALLGVLDGGPLLAADGSLPVDAVREAVSAALPRAPRLRHVVRRTRVGQGAPVWVDAPHFDLDRHIRTVPASAPGDEDAFLRACEAILAPPLDRARPLWDLTLVSGLAAGRVGLVLRCHHVVADGVAAIGLFGTLFDQSPVPRTPVAVPGRWAPAPPPTGFELAADALACKASALRGALGRMSRPRELVASGRAAGLQLATVARPADRQPRTSLTRPLGAARRLAVLGVPLEPVRAVAHACGGTVNDAVLAAVAGGLRVVLAARGEDTGVTLRASVPVSLRPPGRHDDRRPGAAGLGNRVGLMLAPLPLDEPDPLRRLERIAVATRVAKVDARRAGPLAVATSTLAVRLAMPLLRRQRLVSLFVTNVPGPAEPLTLAGATLLEAYPATPLAGNVTLGVGVLSYAGVLGISLVTDADAWPDLPVFVDAVREAFGVFSAAA